MDELQDGYTLGLDLGTTFSCIGVYRNGGVEIIPNRNGERTTPSIVTIMDEKNILAGEDTLEHLVKDYDSSIYSIKRFIGRKYTDKDVKEAINKENFPFKIVGDKQGKFPLILVDKNNKQIKFTFEELSSFVIKKMVDNAEAYLGKKKVKSLVITVPANFNDAQRNCTKQAAKLAGVNVLRIINEPTAAALAYGLGQKTDENEGDKEKKILVFDLGGGTFDVTILKIIKDGEQNFEILSTKGDKFLGGEDFDNKLVEYMLDKFCKKMKESKEEIKKDKKCIKRLKISCENIKRVLSSNEDTTLYLSNFYKGNDIYETITKNEFQNLCNDLFQRLKPPIDDALEYAKLTKNEISEIVLVGGSSRIPKVKLFLKQYFNIKDSNKINNPENQKTRINDSINPDETVAYGATLMAAKLSLKNNNIANFSLMDITPLSLGINVRNKSTNPEIKKEGDLMSVLIKRGSKIPLSNKKIYQTSEDNQSIVSIYIYEGEKKYTRYNHILGKVELYDLPKKKKGELRVEVNFSLDDNGILSVTATEKQTGKSISTRIKNDSTALSDEDIEKIRQKNKAIYEKKKTKTDKDIDYSNLKETLKELQDTYNKSKNEEEKYDTLKNYNEALEQFINLFDKNFDNETMVEKYYIYVKELINSYIKTFKLQKSLSKQAQETTIIKNIKEYIKIFTQQSSGYLDNLVEMMKEIEKKIFFEIVSIVIEELNNCGKKCLEERKKFCKYHSLIYFEKANSYFKKYICDFKNTMTCKKEVRERFKNQIALSESYIKDINSNAILLTPDSLKSDMLIKSNMTGFTNNLLGLKISPKDEIEKYQIVLTNYEKMLSEIEGNTKEKAICISFILKIAIYYLGDYNYKKYYKLGQDCKFIVEELGLDKKEKWYEEFLNIYKEVESNYKEINVPEIKEKIKNKYKKQFDEIDSKFPEKESKTQSYLEFINYILKVKPYKGYEEDKNNKKINFNQDSQDLIVYLQSKYHPDKYSYSVDDEESLLNYFLIEAIEAKLNKIKKNN